MKTDIMLCRAIIFDLDGTLLNTIDDIADSMNSVLQKRKFPLNSIKDYKKFVGDGMERLVERSIPQTEQSKKLIHDCLTEMKKEYDARWSNKTSVYEGIFELLEELHKKKLKMAVLSNKPHDFTIKMVTQYFDKRYFTAVVGQRDGAQPKPDPAVVFGIMDKINAKPEETALIGDSCTDLLTAKNAGLTSIGAAWGFRGREELEKYGADFIAESPKDVLQFFR